MPNFHGGGGAGTTTAAIEEHQDAELTLVLIGLLGKILDKIFFFLFN